MCVYIYIYIHIYTHTYKHIYPRASGSAASASSGVVLARDGKLDEAVDKVHRPVACDHRVETCKVIADAGVGSIGEADFDAADGGGEASDDVSIIQIVPEEQHVRPLKQQLLRLRLDVGRVQHVPFVPRRDHLRTEACQLPVLVKEHLVGMDRQQR